MNRQQDYIGNVIDRIIAAKYHGDISEEECDRQIDEVIKDHNEKTNRKYP